MSTAPVDLPAGGSVDYEAFVRAQAPRLRRLAARRLGDLTEAECLAQETLLRAHRHWHEFADEPSAAAWCTTVAGRLVVDRLRVRDRAVPVAEVAAVAELAGRRAARDAADVVVARAEARTALAALRAVPERQAAVLWARQVEGLSYDEIAARHGLTEPSVRSLLSRGRQALRREYAARGGSLPALGLPLGVLEALRRWKRGPLAAGLAGTAAAGLVAAVGLAVPGPSPDALSQPVVRSSAPSALPAGPAASPAAAGTDAVAPAPAAAAPSPSTPAPAPPSSVVGALPEACADSAVGLGACAGQRDEVPEGGVSVRLPDTPFLPSELSTDVLRRCPTAGTSLCRPSGDDDEPAPDPAPAPLLPEVLP